MEKYDQNAQCDIVYPPATTTSSTSTTVVTTTIFHTTTTEYPIIRDPCHGALPVPYPNTSDNIPDMLENILSNQGKIEVEFKLTYPMPCVGSFREGSIIVFGKAV